MRCIWRRVFKGIWNYTFINKGIEPEKLIELPQDYEQRYAEVYFDELRQSN